MARIGWRVWDDQIFLEDVARLLSAQGHYLAQRFSLTEGLGFFLGCHVFSPGRKSAKLLLECFYAKRGLVSR
jgi:hypothetical protein